MRRKLAAAREIPPREWRVLAEAWAFLLLVGVALRCLPLAQVQRLCARLAGLPRRRPAPGARLGRLVHLIELAARNHLCRIRCLERALALQALLERRGVASELRIGVRREGARLAAHAWLEHAGVPLGEPAGVSDRFLPLRPGLAG